MEGRGYTSYRGRSSGGRPLLTLLLLCVILASAAFILAREQMVYDAEGRLRFRPPWAQEQQPAPTQADPDPTVEIQPPETPPEEPLSPRRGILLSARPLTKEALAASLSQWEGETVAVTLKDSAGRIYFESAAALPAALRTEQDTEEALRQLTEGAAGGAVARISCFLDPRAAKDDVEGRGLKNTGGYIFYDGDGLQWLDPGKEGAQRYLLDLIAEAAALGFGEILLADVSYPTRGKLHKIDFSNAPGSAGDGRQENLVGFLQAVRAILPEGVALSLELPAKTIRDGGDEDAGHDLSRLAPLADWIYASATEAEAPDLAAAVRAAGGETCGFIPQVTQRPSDELDRWLLTEG